MSGRRNPDDPWRGRSATREVEWLAASRRKLQSAPQVVRPLPLRPRTRCSMRSAPRATPAVAVKPAATRFAPSVIVIASRTFAHRLAGLSFFDVRRVPQWATSTRRAVSNWSRPNGTTHTASLGVPARFLAPFERAFVSASAPKCCMGPVRFRRTTTRAQAGGVQGPRP